MDEIRCKIEIREAEGAARLVGTLLPFNEQARDRAELFERGSLSWPSDGVVLRRQHVRESPILRFVPVEVEGRLMIDVPIPSTTAGRDALAEIKGSSGSLPLFKGLSVEFRAVRQTIVAGVRRISEAVLTGAGLVDSPAYESATVEARAKVQRDLEWKRWQREMVL